MPEYDAKEWLPAKGTVTISMEDRHQVQLRVSCNQDVQLLGLTKEGAKVPLKIGREWRTRAKTRGFEAFILKGKPNVEFGYCVQDVPRQSGDPINNEKPPAPPMPGQGNLILEMRRIHSEEIKRNRTPVLEPEDLPFADRYTIDDDDYEFEEDIVKRKWEEANQPKEEPEPSDDPQPVKPGEETGEPPPSEPPEEIAAE